MSTANRGPRTTSPPPSNELAQEIGERLGQLSTERRSVRGGSYLRVVENCVEAVARDVAGMVTSYRYTLLAGDVE